MQTKQHDPQALASAVSAYDYNGAATVAKRSRVVKAVMSLMMCIILMIAGWATLADGQAFGTVTTLAGTALSTGTTDGVWTAARFNTPIGVAIDALGTVAIVVSNCLCIQPWVSY